MSSDKDTNPILSLPFCIGHSWHVFSILCLGNVYTLCCPPPPVFSHGHLHSFSHLVLGTHIHLILFSHISYCWCLPSPLISTHSLRDTYDAISHTPHAFTPPPPPPPNLLWTLALFHPFCVKVRTHRQFLTYLIQFSPYLCQGHLHCFTHFVLRTQTISDISHTVFHYLCQGCLHCFTHFVLWTHRQFLTHLIPFPPISAKDICTVSPLPRTIALFHPCQGHLHCFTPLMSHFNLFFPFCARETLISNCSSSFMSEVILY